MPWETKPDWNEIRHRLADPNLCSVTYARKQIARGVSLLMCRRKDNNKWMNQALRFAKSIFPTIAAAKVWFNAHWKRRNEALWDLMVKGEYSDSDIELLGATVYTVDRRNEEMVKYPESVCKYVLQAHFVDDKFFLSLRVQTDEENLESWNVPVEDYDAVEAPTSLTDAKAYVETVKPKWLTTNDRFASNERIEQPLVVNDRNLLELEDIIDGEMNEKLVGINQVGTIIILEKGELNVGSRKPHFYEYFLEGGKRVLFRLIKVEEARTAMGKLLEGIDEQDRETLLVSLADQFKNIWLSWSAQDVTPYVLSERASEKEWIPPMGVSALPAELKDKIPERYRYWEVEDEKERTELRNRFITESEMELTIVKKFDDSHYLADCEKCADKQYLVEIEREISDGDKVVVSDCLSIMSTRKLERGEFVLMHHFWKGPFVIRSSPETEHYDLFINDKQIVMTKNPLRGNTIASMRKAYTKGFHKLASSGQALIKPGQPGNPTRSTPSYIERLDSGSVTIFKDEDEVKRYEFNGKKLKGVYLLSRTEKRVNKWVFGRVKHSKLEKEVKLSKGQSIRTICLGGFFNNVEKLENGTIRIKSTTLGEGVWNGDFYSRKVIGSNPELIKGVPVYVGVHSQAGEHGDIIEYNFNGRDLETVMEVSNEVGIRKFNSGDYKGPSVEVRVVMDEERGIVDKILKYERVVLVEDPACQVCKIR